MNAHESIEQVLVDDAQRVLPGDEFTRRVMARLPSPVPRRLWWKPLLILGSAALGSVLAMTLAPAGQALLEGFAEIATAGFTPAGLAAAVTAVAMAATAVILAVEAD